MRDICAVGGFVLHRIFQVALGIFLVAFLLNFILGIVIATGVKDIVVSWVHDYCTLDTHNMPKVDSPVFAASNRLLLQGNAEAFNTCVADNTADQIPVDIAAVRDGQADLVSELNGAVASISLDGITSNAGALVGLSFAVLVIAGLWGELSIGT